MRLDKKVAFVTGGSRGIGAGIVERYVAEGAFVAFTYSGSKDKAEALAAKYPGKAIALFGDVTDEGAVKKAITDTIAKFGKLDIVVNNAGYGEFKPVTEITLADYDKIMNINVRGVMITILQALPHLKKGARIINISSCNAERIPFAGGGIYAMSKSALLGLVKGFARDLGPLGITINNIQPGPVDTDMNPGTGPFADHLHSIMAIPRHAAPAEIAGLATYLASDESAFVTGASLTIDGGFNA